MSCQGEEECEVGEFRANMTVTAGRLLRLSCPLASSPACLLATTSVQWQWAPDQQQPRTAVNSQFDNPPYFYLLVPDLNRNFHLFQFNVLQGVLPTQSGWYWCVLGEREAGLAVRIVEMEDSSLVPPPSTEDASLTAVTTERPKVVSTSILPPATELSRTARKGETHVT